MTRRIGFEQRCPANESQHVLQLGTQDRHIRIQVGCYEQTLYSILYDPLGFAASVTLQVILTREIIIENRNWGPTLLKELGRSP